MLFAAAVCWVATACRVAVSLKGPPRLWRWAFSASLFFLAAAITVKARAGVIDRLTTFNLAILVTHLCGIAAGTAGRIHMSTLRHEELPRGVVRRELVLGGVVLAATFLSWLAAPVHAREVPDLVTLAQGPALLMFGSVFYLYLAMTAAEVARVNMLQLRSAARDDLTRHLGHGLAAGSTALGAGVLLLWTGRFAYRALHGSDLPLLATVTTALVPVCVVGLSLGAVMFLVGPVVPDRYRARRLVRQLEPLWMRLRQLHPEVALSGTGGEGQASTVRLEWAMIEIQDALAVSHVRLTSQDLYVDVAASIVTPATFGPVAADVLPVATNRGDEEASLRRLARCYAAQVAHQPRSTAAPDPVDRVAGA